MAKGVEDGVEQAHGRYRLQALSALRGGKSVAASAGNTKRADTVRIYARVCCGMVFLSGPKADP